MSSPFVGTYSNDSYDQAKRYRLKFQKGVPLADSEISEVQSVSDGFLRQLIANNFPRGSSINDGFKIVESSFSTINNFAIKGGDGSSIGAGVLFVDGYILFLKNDIEYVNQNNSTNLTNDAFTETNIAATYPLSPPGTGTRTDSVYVDFYFAEVSANGTSEYTDTSLIVSGIGSATANRIRQVQDIRVAQGTVIPADFTDANGIAHKCVKIAEIIRTTSPNILSSMIFDKRLLVNPVSSYSLGTTTQDLIMTNDQAIGNDTHRISSIFMASTIDYKTNDLMFKNDNVERMRITTSGSIGLGTTAPTEILHIYSTSNPKVSIQSNGVPGTSNKSSLISFGDAQGQKWTVGELSDNNGTFAISRTSSNQSGIVGDILFITPNANVGIGISAPTSKLHVSGTATIDGNLTVNGTTTTVNAEVTQTDMFMINQDDNQVALAVSQTGSGNNATVMTISNAGTGNALTTNKGKVGIGTITPQHEVHIHNSAETDVRLQITTSGSGTSASDGFQLGMSTDTDAIINNRENGPIIFSTNSTEKARIDASGNIGIGTTNPTSKLHVVGANLTQIIKNTFSTPSNSISLQLLDLNDNVTQAFWADGDVGLNTSSAPLGKLDISSGNIALVIGADSSEISRTNNTIKAARIGSIHYTNSEEPVTLIHNVNDSTNNNIYIGGATTQMNAATKIEFYTAANNTTTVGTVRFAIISDGTIKTFGNYINNDGTANKGLKFGTDNVAVFLNSGDINGDVKGTITLQDDAAFAQGVGGGVIFQGKYDATNQQSLAGIKGYKANATSGNNSGQLHFQTRLNGPAPVTRMIIDENGNVGIGTTIPTSLVDIRSATSSTINLKNTGNSNVHLFLDSNISTAGNTIGDIRSFWNGNHVANIAFNAGTDTVNKDDAIICFSTSSASSTPVERMRIDQNGNVGIGTTNPLSKFHVIGDIISSNISATTFTASQIVETNSSKNLITVAKATGYNLALGTTAGTVSEGNHNHGTGNDNYIVKFNGTSAFENSIIYDSGTIVGIGTANPNAATKLHVYSTSSTELYIQSNGIPNSSNQSSLISFGDSQGTKWSCGETSTSDGHFAIRQEGTSQGGSISERFVITPSNGNVGIGISNPSAKLHVIGDVLISNNLTVNGTTTTINTQTTTTDQLVVSQGDNAVAFSVSQTGSGNNSTVMTINNSGTGNALIIGNGNVGIGSANPTTKLDVGGSIRSSATSDQIQFNSYNVTGKTWRIGTDTGSSGANRNLTIWETDSGNLLTIKQSNRYVGIGTTNPIHILHAYNSTANEYGEAVFGGSLGGGIQFAGPSGVNSEIYQAISDMKMHFANPLSTIRMSILQNGDVGIGTQNPDCRLTVGGGVNSGNLLMLNSNSANGEASVIFKVNGDSEHWVVGSGGWSKPQYFCIGHHNSSEPVFVIDHAGHVGIGQIDPTEQLDISGNTKIFGNIFLDSSSSNQNKLQLSMGAYSHNIYADYTTSGIPPFYNSKLIINNYGSTNSYTLFNHNDGSSTTDILAITRNIVECYKTFKTQTDVNIKSGGKFLFDDTIAYKYIVSDRTGNGNDRIYISTSSSTSMGVPIKSQSAYLGLTGIDALNAPGAAILAAPTSISLSGGSISINGTSYTINASADYTATADNFINNVSGYFDVKSVAGEILRIFEGSNKSWSFGSNGCDYYNSGSLMWNFHNNGCAYYFGGVAKFRVNQNSIVTATSFTPQTPADFAEWTEVEKTIEDYEEGCIVQQSETSDMKIEIASNQESVYGIITNRATFCGGLHNADINDSMDLSISEFETKYNAKRVAMTGHVLCKVIGKIKRGQKLVLSEIKGVAKAAVTMEEKINSFCIARQNYDSNEVGLIEVRL